MVNPQVISLGDDGIIPNNQRLPLLVYQRVLGDLVGRSRDPSDASDCLAALSNYGWSGGWINGIYPFQHYHGNTHEVLGIVAGHAKVQMGGPSGPVFEFTAGDGLVIPAGVGHCRLAQSANLCVVGAYPGGHQPDLRRDNERDRAAALKLIGDVPDPKTDPFYGSAGPLLVHWRN